MHLVIPRVCRTLKLLLVSLLVACGGGDIATVATPALPAAVLPGDWLVIGTSTAAGVGAPVDAGWVALLGQALAGRGVRVSNVARAGTLSYHWLPAAAARPVQRPATIEALDVLKLEPASPRLVVLSFPSNDTMAGISASETVDNLLLLRRIELDRGALVFVTSSQPRNDADTSQRATMQAVDAALAAELGHCFVDVRSSLVDADGGLAAEMAAADGVHLNTQGHRKLFDRILAAIVSGRCVPQR
jgi:lysophospholipase L1-like esterase